MPAQTLSAVHLTRLEVRVLDGSLELAGWDQEAVRVSAIAEPHIVESGPLVTSHSEGDTAIHVPRRLPVQIVRVDGGVTVRGVDAPLVLERADGDVRVEDTPRVNLIAVGGDVDARGVSDRLEADAIGGHLAAERLGVLSVRSVGGTAIVSQCAGDCAIESAGLGVAVSDVAGSVLANAGRDAGVRGALGGVIVRAGGDISIRVEPGDGADYELSAGGDANVTIPPGYSAEVFLAAGGAIEVRLPTVREARGRGLRVFTLGNGGAPLRVSAGRDISIHGEVESDGTDERSIVMRLLESGRIGADDARELLAALDMATNSN